MVYRSIIAACALSASLAYGQLDSNTITVTASRIAALQPDQVVFSVDVSARTNVTLDDVVAALASSGITRANFSGVSTPFAVIYPVAPGNPPPVPFPGLVQAIVWNFTLPVSLSKIKDTVANLTALQKSIAQNNSGMILSFSVQGTQVSPQLQQMQTCPIPDLLSDARTEAQKLANAANLFLGPVLAMSSLTTSAAPPCTLTVKFAVTR